MAYPKFILTRDGHLRLGMVMRHAYLLQPGDSCMGGGYYRVNHISKQVILSGSSSDYGPPQWRHVNHVLLPDGYEGYSFVWEEGGEQFPV